jgi:hypothetical protein
MFFECQPMNSDRQFISMRFSKLDHYKSKNDQLKLLFTIDEHTAQTNIFAESFTFM